MVNCVSLVYFSATKTTQKNLRAIAEGIGLPVKEYDFTLPQNRSADITFGPDELVLAGAPVYGGVMPLLEREYLEQHVSGQNTPCVVVAVYGNRAYDDCLVEMEDLMTERGFAVIAAAACIGEHSLTSEIATGRPDESDLAKAKAFGKQLAEKLQQNLSALPKGTIPRQTAPTGSAALPTQWARKMSTAAPTADCACATARSAPSMPRILARWTPASACGVWPACACARSTPSSSPRTPTKVRSRGASPPSRSPARNRNFICKPPEKSRVTSRGIFYLVQIICSSICPVAGSVPRLASTKPSRR